MKVVAVMAQARSSSKPRFGIEREARACASTHYAHPEVVLGLGVGHEKGRLGMPTVSRGLKQAHGSPNVFTSALTEIVHEPETVASLSGKI